MTLIEIKGAKLELLLHATRRINRLVVREHNRDKLLHGICDSLIETSIFSSAWIALFNDSGNLKAFAGAGLGMHIVKNIVEAHDGRIWVKSKFQKGTTVTFTLPV